jgi:hypothetical protein
VDESIDVVISNGVIDLVPDKDAVFERIETGSLVATYMRSKFEDTRRKAIKFGANGSTVKAYKP